MRPARWMMGVGMVLAAACAFAQESGVKRMTVDVWRAPATGQWVEFCLPLAPGELADAAHVRVTNADTQVSVLSTWPRDKSMRVLWVRARPKDASGKLQLEYGKGLPVAIDRIEKTLVDSQADGVVITTGPLRVKVSSKELKPLEQVWLDANGDGKFSDDESVLGPSGVSPRLTTLDGKSYVAVGAPTVTVEESGPLCAVVCVKGQLAPADKKDAAADELFQVTYRVKACAGSSAVWVQHLLKRAGRPFAFPMPKQADAEREFALLVPVDALGLHVQLRAAGPQLSYAVGGAGKVIGEGGLAKDAKKTILAGGDFRRNAPTTSVVGEGAAKPGALEWLDVAAGKVGVAVAVRDAALLFPKGYELDGNGGVSIDLWKDSPPRAALEIGSGYSRAHDIVLLFHADAPGRARGEQAAALTVPARALVPAEQFRASTVFGPLPKSLDALPPGFDELQKTLVAQDVGSRILYGEAFYGSTVMSGVSEEGRMGYAGGAYNSLAVRGALFALYGNRDYYDDVDRMGRWTRDWDMKHRNLANGAAAALAAEPSNTLVLFVPTAEGGKGAFPGQPELFRAMKEKKRRLGVIQLASWCRGGPCQRNRDVALEGMLYHYFLTGDPASGEAAREAADGFLWLATCPEDFGNPRHPYVTAGLGHRFHVGGKFMLNLMIAYESLGDAKYLDAVKAIWGNMLQATKTHKLEWPRDDERYWEATSMMSWPHQCTNFTRPAWQYYRWTGDETIKEYAGKLAAAIVNERWDGPRRQFWKGVHTNDVGQDTVVKGRIYLDSQSLPLAGGVGWSCLMSGSQEQMVVAREAYAYSCERIAQMKAAGKFSYDINSGNLLTSFQGLLGAMAASAK